MSSQMSRDLPIALLGLVVVTWLAAGAPAAARSTCHGLPLLGTAAELAATPRERPDLEGLAIEIGGGFTADPAIYDRLVADFGALATTAVGSLPVIPQHDGKTLLLTVEPATHAAIAAGTYHAWDCLNEWYGLAEIEVLSSPIVFVVLDGTFDTRLLADAYASLPGVLTVEPNRFAAWDFLPPATCVFAQGRQVHYLLYDALGFVPGCPDRSCYFTSEPGASPRYRGSLSPSPLTPGSEVTPLCAYSAPSASSSLQLSLEPAQPLAGEPTTLVARGIPGCPATPGEVTVDPATRVVRVHVDSDFGCVEPPQPFDVELPLGELPAGEWLATVTVTNNVDANSAIVAALWIDVQEPEVADTACAAGTGQPGATLLVPYFEVDAADDAGRTTLIAVGNASGQPVDAHLTLWTDRGHPTFSYSVALAAGAVKTINLRDVLVHSAAHTLDVMPLRCEPPLDPEAVLELIAKHGGQPAADGLCYGSPAAEPGLLTGYLTVDVVRDGGCYPDRHPGSPGYFEPGGSGFALNRNVLWGDVIYVSSGDDSAQGVRAVAIPADDRLGEGDPTFYGGWIDGSGADGRVPLGRLHRSRYLEGGPLATATELLLWTEGQGGEPGSTVCGPTTADPGSTIELLATVRDEGGHPTAVRRTPFPNRVARLAAGSEALPTAGPFGQLDVAVDGGCQLCGAGASPLDRRPLQSWLVPILRAAGRFSVATDAARLDPSCR